MSKNDPDLPALRAAPAPEPQTEVATHERLRAFEDAVLGEDHLRLHGEPERGRGSKFAELHPAAKAHHAALEALIAAEAEYQKAAAIEIEASAKLDAAVQRAAETEEALPADTVDPEPEAGK